MKSNHERARQLYQQCQKAYHDYLNIPNHARSLLQIDGKSIDVPSNFYDAYNVPAELLYKEIRVNKVDDGDRIDFDHRLLLMMHKKQDFDRKTLEAHLNPKDKRLKNHYTVYFEAYYHETDTSKPIFKKQLSFGGLRFQRCSSRILQKQIHTLEGRNDTYKGLYIRRRNERFSLSGGTKINELNLHPMKVYVKAYNEEEAANLVVSQFENFTACVNVIQALGSQTFSLFRSGPSTKHKTAIVSMGVLLVKKPGNNVDILWDTSKKILPSVNLTIANSQSKIRRLKKLIRVFMDDSTSAKRLRYITQELAQAIDTENANVRQLSYWRCLEIATAKSDRTSRKESDIVKIFQNYYPESMHWHQMGELIKNLRNTYVHQGVNTDVHKLNDYHLNWSQQYAECAFNITTYLYDNRATWRTASDIDIFYDCYAQSDRALELANKFLAARKK